jgi:hypothetical protein
MSLKVLIDAVETNKVDIVRFVLQDMNLQLGELGNKLFIKACELGYDECVCVFLKDGRINPRYNKNNALQVAENSGHKNIVRILMKDPRVYRIQGKAKPRHRQKSTSSTIRFNYMSDNPMPLCKIPLGDGKVVEFVHHSDPRFSGH